MSRQLTEEQRRVAFSKSGLFVVKACPGSGKTFTVGARLHRLVKEWQFPHVGVAAISFTNVAWQEIEHYLANDFDMEVPLHYPHFLGTIDSFINQFIFLPFGHRVMACAGRLELTGPPYDQTEPIGTWLWWPRDAAECWKYCRLNSFSYDVAGRLTITGPDPYRHFGNCQSGHVECGRLKRVFNQAGFATQADANYFAMKALTDYPAIAEALARRFPVVILDEAQDTSRIQMRILDALIKAGLEEVILVGDPYQAIYEWRDAEPRLFEEKFQAWGENCTWLTENWRSTQSICHLACRLACSGKPMYARNEEVRAFDHQPVFYGYESASDLPNLFEAFREHCEGLGIGASSISVLARTRDFVNDVLPGTVPRTGLSPWREGDWLTRQVAHAKYLSDRAAARDGLRKLERAAYRHLTGRANCRSEEVADFARSVGLGEWRGTLFGLLEALPDTQGKLSDWVLAANDVLARCPLFENASLAIKQDRRPHRYSDWTFQDAFQDPETPGQPDDVVRGTIHSAKGRGLDAVFLALKTKGAAGRHYPNMFGSNLLDEEELRLVYVAVTRARKALAIAVPNRHLDAWRRFLLAEE